LLHLLQQDLGFSGKCQDLTGQVLSTGSTKMGAQPQKYSTMSNVLFVLLQASSESHLLPCYNNQWCSPP